MFILCFLGVEHILEFVSYTISCFVLILYQSTLYSLFPCELLIAYPKMPHILLMIAKFTLVFLCFMSLLFLLKF